MPASVHYDESYYRSQMQLDAAAYDLVARLRAEKIQHHILPRDRVIEFGVGSGLNLAAVDCALRDGFDINLCATEEAIRRGVRIINSLGGAGIYDVAICHHCLEHVSDPATALRTMQRLLRLEGRLLLFVPYEEQRRYRRHIKNDKNHHLFSWTPHSLANLVEDCGFSVTSARLGRFGYDRIAARIATHVGIGELGFRALRQTAHLLRPEREVRVVATSLQRRLSWRAADPP